MMAAPLPLSIADVDQYLSCRPVRIDREEFEAAIFALDDAFRDAWSKEQDKTSKTK